MVTSRHIACGALLASILILSAAPNLIAADLTIGVANEGLTGQISTVDITVDQQSFEIAGFDLLLALDQSRYSVVGVTAGSHLENCGWEYFSYRVFGKDSVAVYQAFGSTNLLRIVGTASVSDGFVPGCFGGAGPLELAKLDILVANEIAGRPIRCEFLPIRFFWRNCGDNILTNAAGDTAHVASQVSDYGVPGPLPYPFPGYGAPEADCDSVVGESVLADIAALNGGIDVLCNDPLYLLGDLNLNGIPYEIGDVLVMTLYFQYGLSVLPWPNEMVFQNSDVNMDGLSMTVADLVFMIRVVLGDAPPK